MNTGKDIKVSICCVVYNHSPYLRQCLDGLLMQQTSFDFEILLHDDASTDGTTDIIREYAAAYPDLIRPVIQTENQYSSKTRAIITTYLLPLAKGKYIALCEGDDYWTDPLKLQKQVDMMETNPDISICTHLAVSLFANGAEKIHTLYKQNQIAPFVDVIRSKQGYWPTASYVYRKALLKNYPQFCLNCHVGDAPLLYFMAIQGKVYFFSEVMSVYRKRVPGSHTYKIRNVGDAIHWQAVQTEFDMLDGFNAWTNYTYNTLFIEKKLHLQSNILAKRKTWHTRVYTGFDSDLRSVALYKRIKLIIKIYLLPVLRGNFFKTEKRER